ncbi:MAG: hypothetical protein J5752_00560 [Clostridiales bacterium]|nr:hypothetical protein [Clostridiales bacterium]
MGLFDIFTSTEGESYGYKTFKNTVGWDNAKVLELLFGIETNYGTPKMGWIRAFGKEREVVVYSGAHKVNYIYVDAQPKKIIVSMAPKPGQIGGAKDHIDANDICETDADTVSATTSCIEYVNGVIEIIKPLLEEAKSKT